MRGSAKSVARRSREGAPAGAVPVHALPVAEVLRLFGTSTLGLGTAEASERLAREGPNALPRSRPPFIAIVLLRQFLSPLIYVLLAASAISLAIGKITDAAFIFAVLLLNAVIGAVQEHAAYRGAEALRGLIVARARVVRDGVDVEIDAEGLVPGDLVRMEGGLRVQADMRIVSEVGLGVEEALLTGESLPVPKRSEPPVAASAPVADRACMLFAGTLVARGRASAVVVATGLRTELGRIASAAAGAVPPKPPLLVRMDSFSRRIAAAVGVVALVLGVVSAARGLALGEVFLSGVALAVSAIPEGLPVALTIALSIGARRMARRRVIARRLVAVEALGSCTYIASDKTGTLTQNELSARAVQLPEEDAWEVVDVEPGAEGGVAVAAGSERGEERLRALCSAAALCNDGYYGQRNGAWARHGDAVDVALLVLAHKLGVSRPEAEAAHPRIADIPFEAEHRFEATLHSAGAGVEAFAKGAVERILPMCVRMAGRQGEVSLDPEALTRDAEALAERGYRVLAVAGGRVQLPPDGEFLPDVLQGLVFLGLVGMIDPLRPEAKASIDACREAGIDVAMVTGDHPVTALAIARDLGLASGAGEVVVGARLAEAASAGTEALDALVHGARVFARVDPVQKLEIVKSLRRLGHFVAVTGDGANDAPAMRAAHIGVAMGRRGTDVARESAELVLADDNFASIVAGVEEGRVAYANVRKVIFLLVSTGAAEIVLFLLAVAFGTPLPLLPVQLLWLNLVTNGIQDVALAFEPAEGGEMARPPRAPREPIFDQVMLVRTAVSAAVMGLLAFAGYWAALRAGWGLDRIRNGVLLVMVLFENVQAGNSRSETRGVLHLSPLRNPVLLFGTLAALALHVASMHLPGIARVLHVQPAGAWEWCAAGVGALVLAGAVDLEKAIRKVWTGPTARPALFAR